MQSVTPSEDTIPAVAIEDLSVLRGSDYVLVGINCEISRNTLTVIFGPNGAGKTTLLQVLTGELTPQAGSVRIFGRPQQEVKGEIGYVPQFFSVRRDFPLTVFAAVAMGLYPSLGLIGRLTKQHRQRVAEALERLHVLQHQDELVKNLSGGQLQRVMIARALVAAPKILLLDEATSGIDVGAKESLYELLVQLKKEMTVIFVTHDMSVISQEVDSILCLNKKLVSHGTPAVALSDEAIRCMYGDGVAVFSHCSTPHVHVKEHL